MGLVDDIILLCLMDIAPLCQMLPGTAGSDLIHVLVRASLPADDGET